MYCLENNGNGYMEGAGAVGKEKIKKERDLIIPKNTS